MSTDNAYLRARLRGGDHDAFEQLYLSLVDDVFGVAYRMTGSRTIAEDVASETFLVVWRSRGHIDSRAESLRGWVLSIAVKQSLNQLRSLRRRRTFLSRVEQRTVEPDFAADLVDRLDDIATLARIPAAMNELTRAEASVVGLCVWSDLTYAEAADALDIPVGTVRSRLARARERLRRLTDDPPLAEPTRRLSLVGPASTPTHLDARRGA